MTQRETVRDRQGRFGSGNKAARGRRSPGRTTEALIEIIDERLRAQNSSRSLRDYVGDCFLKLISAAGEGDVKAAIYVVDKLFPSEREPAINLSRMPSPTKKPLQYLDALARNVVRGEITTAQCARLANLAKPLIIDEQLRATLEEIAALQERFSELRQSDGGRSN